MPNRHEGSVVLLGSEEEMQHQVDDLLGQMGWAPCEHIKTVFKAQGRLLDAEVDIILLDTPLGEEDVFSIASDMTKNRAFRQNVILLGDAAFYERNLYRAEQLGLVILRKPLDSSAFMQTLRLLQTMHQKIRRLENRAEKLEQRLEDDRLLSRAKMILISSQHMSEEEAHRHIERCAMDRSAKKTLIAEEIIRAYETYRRQLGIDG